MNRSVDAASRDHRLFSYSAIPSRRKLAWPGGQKLAVPIFLHFETYDLNASVTGINDQRFKGRYQPDLRFYSWYEYGNRVAIFRVLDLLDRFGLKATVAANALACERYPYLVDAFKQRGYEIAGHGIAANAMVSSQMSAAKETRVTLDSLDRIQASCGERPIGWVSQDTGESANTPAILANAGVRYLADWPNDDQPYCMPGAGNLISLPAPGEWDDQRLLWDRKVAAWHFPVMVRDAIEQLRIDSVTGARYFALSIHPWLSGAPHRVAYLEQALAFIAAQPDLWNPHASEIADCIPID